jgi:hypothetical protein
MRNNLGPVYYVFVIIINIITITIATYAVNCMITGKCYKLSWFYAIFVIIFTILYLILAVYLITLTKNDEILENILLQNPIRKNVKSSEIPLIVESFSKSKPSTSRSKSKPKPITQSKSKSKSKSIKK